VRVQVEALAVKLRPRAMSEAVDLGVRLVQAHAHSVWASFAPVYLIVVLIAMASGAIADWLPTLVIFCFKPWLDRTLLFVLSRAVFGTPTRLTDVWAAQREVWWRQLWRSFTLQRFSPWRSYTAPGLQLEGQRGSAWRMRRAQLLRGKQGAALGMHLVFAHFELLLTFSAVALAALFAPDTARLSIWSTLTQDSGTAVSLTIAGIYAGIVLLLEPFYVGAGFAMYLNRRVELEAWDIEQEFRVAFAA
jgi:hypothetical protein